MSVRKIYYAVGQEIHNELRVLSYMFDETKKAYVEGLAKNLAPMPPGKPMLLLKIEVLDAFHHQEETP